MAEIVGTVAAATQLADLTINLLLRTNRLRAKVRHLPETLKQAGRSVRQFAALLESLSSELEQPDGLPDVLSHASITLATDLLKDCGVEIDALDALLSQVTPLSNDTKLKHARRVFDSVFKEDEIQIRFQRLDKLLATVVLWCDEQNLRLGWKQFKEVSLLHDRVQSLGQQLSNVEVAVQDARRDSVSQSGAVSVSLSDSLLQCHSSIQKSTALASSMDGKLQDVQSSLSDLENFLQRPQNLSESSVNALATVITTRILEKPSLMAKAIHSQSVLTPVSRGKCTCGSSDWGQTPTVRTRHIGLPRSTCPVHGNRRRPTKRFRWSTCPAILAWGLRVVLTCSFGAGGLSISTNFFPVNIVDPESSPAFARIKRARSKFGIERHPPACRLMARPTFNFFKSILEDLLDDLVTLFREGASSGRDQTASGWTLVHEFALFLDYLCEPLLLPLREQLETFVDVLVDAGAQLDAIGSAVMPWSQEKQTGTALQLFIRNFDFGGRICAPNEHSLENVFPKILSVRMGEIEDTKLLMCSNFNQVRSVFSIVRETPDLALDFGCSALSLAAANRDMESLKKFLTRENNINEHCGVGCSPLCFAVGWKTGMEVLLEAGADASVALQVAIFYQDLVMVEFLLQHNPRIFASGRYGKAVVHNSTWDYAIETYADRKRTSSADISILKLIVLALAEYRRQLMRLAKCLIPNPRLIELGWPDPSDDETLIDCEAWAVAKEVQDSYDCPLPDQLWPNRGTSIYHHTDIDSSICQILFEAGFRRFDGGRRSLLKRCVMRHHRCSASFDVSRWFLDHGADPTFHGYGSHLGHMAAALVSACRSTAELEQRAGGLTSIAIPYVQQLLTTPDSCLCFCSTSGCLPANKLTKDLSCRFRNNANRRNARHHDWVGLISHRQNPLHELWHIQMQYLNYWQELTSPGCPNYHELREVCRLELFERLGMAHTCCKMSWGVASNSFKTAAEIQELRSEDEEVAKKLANIMAVYDLLVARYRDDIRTVWSAWWDVVDTYLKPLRFQRVKRRIRIIRLDNVIEDDELEPMLEDVQARVAAAMSQGSSSGVLG